MKAPVADDISSLRQKLDAVRHKGSSIGLVPTMGALHRGHASLMDLARADNEFVVVSIFVNPIQFGPHEDLAHYPRPLDADLELCGRCGVDLVFTPTPDAMYPAGFRTFVEVSQLPDGLCGPSRPGHFRGVTTVVLKLFNLVQPTRAYFGQKDGQQARVIQQMVRDLDVPVEIIVGPTVREPDGLALSSRNRYLDADQRRDAVILYRALMEAQELIKGGERDPARVRRHMADRIGSVRGAIIDYAEVVNADTLQPLERLHGTVLAAVAVRFGATRLIDNILISVAS